MGSFGIRFDERLLFALFSAIKVPFLLLTCFAMTLPLFLVVNTLLGLRTDVPDVVRHPGRSGRPGADPDRAAPIPCCGTHRRETIMPRSCSIC